MTERSSPSLPSKFSQMPQTFSSSPQEQTLRSPPRYSRATSLDVLYPALPSIPHDDGAHRIRKRRRFPQRPSLAGSNPSSESASPIQRRRKPRYSSPAVLQAIGIHEGINDSLLVPPVPGAFPQTIIDPATSSQTNVSPVVAATDGEIRVETNRDYLNATQRNIDDVIRKRIKTSLTPARAIKRTRGYVYILEDLDFPGIFKIGSTDRTVTERREEIEDSCGQRLVERYRSPSIPLAQRAEKLCHDYLDHYRRPFPCTKCTNSATGMSTYHGEWFEVPIHAALECVKIWTTFLQQEPYNLQGILHPFWLERLGTTDCGPGKQQRCDDEARHQHWKAFTHVSSLDLIKHRGSCILRDCHCIEFWRNWFTFLFMLSLLLHLYDVWIGNGRIVQIFISFGCFIPTLLIQPSITTMRRGSNK